MKTNKLMDWLSKGWKKDMLGSVDNLEERRKNSIQRDSREEVEDKLEAELTREDEEQKSCCNCNCTPKDEL